MNMKKSILTGMLLLSTLGTGAWAQGRAVAVIEATAVKEAPKERVMGELYFEEKDGKLHIWGEITGLKPNSKHGFHIHQYGDKTKPDGTSAGGHFNPDKKPHAGPGADHHHAGDFGNITADAQGKAKVDITADWLTVSKGTSAVLGHSVVVHAKADDLKSQPSGDAGDRIGIGVIGWANPESK